MAPARPDRSLRVIVDLALREAGWRFVGVAAFPRLAYRLRWPTRLGPRGLLLYIAFNTALLAAIRTWLFPLLRRHTEHRERLRAQLGHEPSDQELTSR
ncbi:hypothetical protein [Conexibacter woesei]|uniref:hypothetical protein n=1 Tax=Conexibacter woesei TaxID=191495 RepID=UPI00042A7E9D|nr:hypothetical protein [Conexibacter woesei]